MTQTKQSTRIYQILCSVILVLIVVKMYKMKIYDSLSTLSFYHLFVFSLRSFHVATDIYTLESENGIYGLYMMNKHQLIS